MKLATLKPCVLFAFLASIVSTVACGGAKFNDPPGVANASVSPTQNPLVAQYTVTSALGCAGQVMVEFGPDTSYGRTTAWYPATATSQTSTILVAGMRASTTYHMRAQAQALCSGGTSSFVGPDLTFTTGPLPSNGFPALAVTRPNPSSSSPENPGIELVDVISPNDVLTQAFFTDRDANPIWFYATPNYNPETIKFLPNGHLIFSLVNGSDSLLREVDLAGNTIREMDISGLQEKMQSSGFDFIPVNLHHDLLPLANGHLMVLVNFQKTFTDVVGYPGDVAIVGDGVIDLDQNWNPVWAWNSFDYLDINRHLNGLPDWTHSNALVYTADGNLLISMRHQSWILKLDYNNGTGSGNVLWHFGYQGDFALTQNGIPTDDPSEWFSFQHFPSIVSQNGSETTLAVWDNGDNRVLDTNGDLCGAAGGSLALPCYSRATIFQIDESAMAANLLWANPLQFYGIWGGSINQLSNGNVEFDLNAPAVPPGPEVASQIQEVTQTSTPQVVWQMQISPVNQNAYRAYRVPSLYPGVTWQY
jgi:arylsulfate sulfotransferase